MRTLLVVLVLSGTAHAESAKPPTPEALVQRLGDARFQDREAAVKSLLQRGAAVIPALKHAIATSADPEIRNRAENVLQRLERMAESERLVVSKLVSLKYRATPLSAAVADLKKQTGLNLVLDSQLVKDSTRPITLIEHDLPVWIALEKFCTAAGLHEHFRADYPRPSNANVSQSNYNYSRMPGIGGQFGVVGDGYDNRSPQFFTPALAPIVLVDGVAEPVPGNRTSAIRVLAMPGRFSANRIVRGAGRVLLNFDIAPAELNWNNASVRVSRAEDEDGRPVFADLKPESPYLPNNDFYSPWGFNRFMTYNDYGAVNSSSPTVPNPRLVPVSLRTEDRDVRMLRRLDGVVVGEISQPNSPLITLTGFEPGKEVGDQTPQGVKLIAKDVSTTVGDKTVFRIVGEMASVVQQQRVFGRPMMVENQIGNLMNALKFYDTAGVECARPVVASMSQFGGGWGQTQRIELDMQFAKSAKHGPPVKIVYVGTKVLPVEVPFQMQNVRLP